GGGSGGGGAARPTKGRPPAPARRGSAERPARGIFFIGLSRPLERTGPSVPQDTCNARRGRPVTIRIGPAMPGRFLPVDPRPGPMRVLVIEDEPELRRVLAQALREDGYAVDQAADGPDGLFKATAWAYDLVLLDLMLPGLDGLELLQRLRREKHTPVLVLTARDAVPDRIRGLDVGADDYVVKPFNLAEVLARVRALIRRAAGRGDSTIVVGDVEIDTARRAVA